MRDPHEQELATRASGLLNALTAERDKRLIVEAERNTLRQQLDEAKELLATNCTIYVVDPKVVAEKDAAVAALTSTREALKRLVERLNAVHGDPAYESVWTLHQIHAGPYQGPSYEEELTAARAVLLGASEEPK